MTFERVDITPGAKFEYSWQGSAHYLAWHDIVLKAGEIFTARAQRDRRTNLQDALTFVPAGSRVWGWSDVTQRPQSFTAVYFEPDKLPQDVARLFEGFRVPRVYFSDGPLVQTLRKIHQSFDDGEPLEPLYLEAVSTTAVFELTRSLGKRVQPKGGKLTAQALARVDEYVAGHIGGEVTLDALASLTGLSRYHFIRAFSGSRGRTPYQFVIEKRIERARQLLTEQEMPVATVAQQVGFKSASRFIQAFRRIVGMTPGALATQQRKGRRSRT